MIDLHSHVLPELDDGAATIDDSLAIARAAADDGVQVLAGTPHVRADYPTSVVTMEERVQQVQAAVTEAGVPIEIVGGAELSVAEATRLDDADLRRFSLGGGGSLLLEFPYSGWPLELSDLLFKLQARGFRTVLAHPERNGEVAARPGRLQPLVEAGALIQVTASALDGRLGRTSQRAARQLLALGLVHLIATDAHDATAARIGMRAAARAIGGELAGWLTADVPRAVLEGDPLPARPACGPSLRFRAHLGRGR